MRFRSFFACALGGHVRPDDKSCFAFADFLQLKGLRDTLNQVQYP